MTIYDACFEFTKRVNDCGEVTEQNAQEFLEAILHYSKPPFDYLQRERALVDAAVSFLSNEDYQTKWNTVSDDLKGYVASKRRWDAAWLGALADAVVHAEMRMAWGALPEADPRTWTGQKRLEMQARNKAHTIATAAAEKAVWKAREKTYEKVFDGAYKKAIVEVHENANALVTAE